MKAAALSLPLTAPASLHADTPLRRARPLRVEWVDRHGPALHRSPLSPTGDVLGLNLARGCIHHCASCFARAYREYPGDQVVHIYRNTPEQLSAELDAGLTPRAVFLSPASDPFLPLVGLQAETARAVEVLATRGIEAWLMTRGTIQPAALRVLERHRERVKVTIPLTTLDAGIHRLLEPDTTSPQGRLQQLLSLRERGVAVQVSLDPLVPGLTDSRVNLEPLLASLASAGIQRVSAGYLFLRPAIEKQLQATLAPHGWDEAVLGEFQGGPVLSSASVASARYLPKKRRQHGYAAVMTLAAEYRISVAINSMSNPDFAVRAVERPRSGRGTLLAAFLEGKRTVRS